MSKPEWVGQPYMGKINIHTIYQCVVDELHMSISRMRQKGYSYAAIDKTICDIIKQVEWDWFAGGYRTPESLGNPLGKQRALKNIKKLWKKKAYTAPNRKEKK